MTTTAQDSAHPPDAHGDAPHDHPKFLAHHFETPQQQFDSGKLGVWLFLTTEVLLFSGLFCAYSVYRANHPEIFAFAHLYLNKWYGALNTIVLIFSSFTMAWAVRASQLGQRKLCSGLLIITISCGGVFMVVKAVEYYAKFQEYLLPGEHFRPTELPNHAEAAPVSTSPAAVAAADASVAATVPAIRRSDVGYVVEQSLVPRASTGPAGLGNDWAAHETSRFSAAVRRDEAPESVGPEPANTHIFFGIYFLMTGLHGIHVLGGMGLIAWCWFRNRRGDFGPEYFTPVDFVGLYWHIVDLIWIFLFPLLYLIGNTP